MKKGLARKENKFQQFPETGSGIHVLRMGRNERFQWLYPTEWCPDQLVSKFHISMIKAPHSLCY